MQAAALGIRTPRILGVADAGLDGMVLAYEAIDGISADRVDDIDDDALIAVWSMVHRLHDMRIAHRDLRLANILLDADRTAWLIDFGFSELAASDQLLGTDVAELLASTAARGRRSCRRRRTRSHRPRRTRVGDAVAATFGAQHRRNATAIGGDKGLAPIRELLIEQCGVPEEEPVRLQRVSGKTLFVIATIGLSAWLLIPQLADIDNIWKQIRGASGEWVVIAVAFSLLTYVAATASLLGAIPIRLRFVPALAAQIASSFANRITPAKVGGIGDQRQILPAPG